MTSKQLRVALEELEWELAFTAYPSRNLMKAVTAIRQARALDKKAENARELGLDYEPVREDWGPGPHEVHSLPPAAPVQDNDAHYKGVVEGVQKLFDDKRAQPGPVQEPVAKDNSNYRLDPPEAEPAQRQWVGLTDEERNKLWRDVVKWGDPSHDDVDLIKAIEAKLKELNT